MIHLITRAIIDTDWVLSFDYTDRNNIQTRRVASPYRLDGHTFLALCLSREEPRSFRVDRCSNMELRPAHLFLMPLPTDAAGKTAKAVKDRYAAKVQELIQ